MKTKTRRDPARNALYAQSGGVSAVINASACGVIETARRHRHRIGRVYAGRDGIIGALTENMIDLTGESAATIRALRHTPAGAFGSARFKLKSLDQNRAEYERLIEVFRAHDIGYFFYNGGNDSMDTAWKISQIGATMNYPVICVGIPKTVDNDLPITDCCPGFGSVAKYIAVSTLEGGLDVASMARTSTKVFVLEVMGRHAGWIAAAGGLAGRKAAEPPHIILFPEITFDRARFLERVQQCVGEYGYCVIVVSEGARYPDGKFLAESGTQDAFGHTQLGGGEHGARGTGLQVPLGGRRLSAALSASCGLRDRRQAGLRGRQSRGRVRAGGNERGDAGDQTPVVQALSLEARTRAPQRGGQRREESAAPFHHRRRLWHHCSLPALSAAADRRGGSPALSRRAAQLCPHPWRCGSAPAQEHFQALNCSGPSAIVCYISRPFWLANKDPSPAITT